MIPLAGNFEGFARTCVVTCTYNDSSEGLVLVGGLLLIQFPPLLELGQEFGVLVKVSVEYVVDNVLFETKELGGLQTPQKVVAIMF